ncbi:MAG TPA: hypothetical protein QF564_00625 [Pirellulaceae bacterium]|nr:hypothetical protein [Pirellulaceae bacterium]
MNTDLLVERLIQKRDVLSQLRKLADHQTRMVGDGDVSKLMGLLATKQRLLNGLRDVETSLDPFRDEDPDHRVWRSAAERQEARDIAGECDRLLDEVKRIEQNDTGELIARRDAASSALRGIQGASRARSAYLEQSPHQTGNLDMSSDI